MKKLLACLLAAAWLTTAPVQAQQLQPIDGIAAVVDEDVILDNELDRAVNNILTQYAGQQGQLPPRDVLRRQVLERLVLLKLQVARARSTGIRVDEQEIDRAISAIAAQNQMSPEQLRTQVTADGTSYDEFRSSIRDELLVQRLRQRFAQSQVSVSDAEVEAAMSSQQAGGSQFRLAHILVALPDGATPEQIKTAAEKISGIKALLDRGEMDFAAAAVRYSDSPNALEGGDLGWRAASEIPSAFSELVRGLSPGEVTDPLRGPSGFQLLQLVDVRDASSAPAGPVTQYQARHILIRVPEGAADDSQARARAETLRARIAGGADFAEIAREHSEDPSSQARGGELGWFTQDQFGPDFGNQVARLGDGEISAPFRTQAGWHVVERLGTRQTEVADESLKNQVRETIGRRKLEDQWNRFLTELRGEAFVDVRDGTAEADEDTAAPASGG
ncbi:MAG: peptidylprolyl isomerase [Pseudomonadota bacterium]|nr:peptidylprolyl isomerase [Pseudomonadota bacterium]